MTNDNVTVTTNTSWFSRLGGALKGVLFGFVMILVSIALLSWNENRSITSIRTNNEGAKTVVSADANRVDPANEGKLIHISGAARAEGSRVDPLLGVSADGLVLTRSVEYFQWVETSQSETRAKLGGGQETVTTYSYSTEWRNAPVDSSTFNTPQGHVNPAATLKSETVSAPQVTIGAYRGGADIVGQLSATTALTPNAEQVQAASRAIGKPVVVQQEHIFLGANPAAPQVGDMKVTYSYLPQATALSIVAAQTQGELTAFIAGTGNRILMVRDGTASADEMFESAKATNKAMTWGLRALGVVLMIVAFNMILAPLGVLADVVPFIGSIVRMGTGLIAGVLGVALSLVVIAVAWIVFRPVLGISLLLIAAAAVAGIVWMRRRKASAQPVAA